MKTFEFLGHVFDSDRVTTLVRTTGAVIKVKAADLNVKTAKLITPQNSVPCVVHHENQYHALSLPESFRPSKEMPVRIISKPYLKRFRANA